jgi:tripartite-type tricarboxylate transporter receptor subunit TctC
MQLRTGLAAALFFFAAAALVPPSTAQAQNYPNQPIRLIVPWPPGGGVDTSARIIAQPLGERLGQSVIIDNRPGAGGNIGTEAAARAKPDGYTLVMASSSPNAINIHIYPKLPFDPLKDFAAIGYVTAVPNILVVPGTSPMNSAQELLAHIKANPGRVNYGSAGVGSSQHLAASMLITATGINIVHVPYKGTGPAETDLIAGHIAMMLDTTACLPFVAGGRMKAFAVASKARNPALPNVPTFDELGIPGVYSSAWYGLMAPAGTPQAIVERINAELNTVLKSPDVRKKIADFGGEPGGGTPADFERFVASELQRYAAVVKASGARVE